MVAAVTGPRRMHLTASSTSLKTALCHGDAGLASLLFLVGIQSVHTRAPKTH
jgi:hypothetical protein